jgi:hypothetical protein
MSNEERNAGHKRTAFTIEPHRTCVPCPRLPVHLHGECGPTTLSNEKYTAFNQDAEAGLYMSMKSEDV